MMGKQKIEVVIDCSDEMMLQELMEKAITVLVVDRINDSKKDALLLVKRVKNDNKHE